MFLINLRRKPDIFSEINHYSSFEKVYQNTSPSYGRLTGFRQNQNLPSKNFHATECETYLRRFETWTWLWRSVCSDGALLGLRKESSKALLAVPTADYVSQEENGPRGLLSIRKAKMDGEMRQSRIKVSHSDQSDRLSDVQTVFVYQDADQNWLY